MLYHVVYARVDTEGEVYNRNTENTKITWFSFVKPMFMEETLKVKGYIFIMLECSTKPILQ